MGLTRTQGWEQRLVAYLEAARRKPYVLGEHDCLRVALGSVEALTGKDLWPLFAGKYATRLQSLRLLADRSRWAEFSGQPLSVEAAEAAVAQAGSPFDAAFNLLFGTELTGIKRASRGDVCKYSDGEEHLGVCTGSFVAVLTSKRMAFVPLLSCRACWRIG